MLHDRLRVLLLLQTANPPLDLRKEGGENFIMLVDRGPTTNPCKFAEKVGNATALMCHTEMR